MTSELSAGSMAGRFAATRWTLVVRAGDPQSPLAVESIEALCRTYWRPLYAFVRRRGYSRHDAEDMTQAFFAQLLEHQWVADADRQKGRFRSFLLMAFRRFLAKEWDKARTIKRGGRIKLVPLELDAAETHYLREPADTRTPEQLFEKQWALTLLQTVLQRLCDDYTRADNGRLFAVLEPCLIGASAGQPYAELAAGLGMTEGAVKVAVHRLRARYRECLKEEVAHTVATPGEVDEELRHLFRVLARNG